MILGNVYESNPGDITMTPDGQPPRSTDVFIKNLDDLKDMHECKSTDKLTEILVSIGRMDEVLTSQAACMQELSSRFEEQTRQIQQMLMRPHECISKREISLIDADIKSIKNEIEALKKDYNERKGAEYYIRMFIDSAKYLILLAIGAFLMFILEGGSLAH